MSDSHNELPADELERVLHALRTADSLGETEAAQDVDALFASIDLESADGGLPITAAELQRVLREQLPPLEAPAELEGRVRDACDTIQRPRRILRMTPGVATWAAAAAVLLAVMIPVLLNKSATPGTSGPRLVLRIVDEPLDVRFDGRAMLHARSESSRSKSKSKPEQGGRDR